MAVMSPLPVAGDGMDGAGGARHKKKKTMKSLYLTFFETAPDGKSRACTLCGKSYCLTTATGNLGKHLSNRHPGYDQLADHLHGDPSQSAIASMFAKNKKLLRLLYCGSTQHIQSVPEYPTHSVSQWIDIDEIEIAVLWEFDSTM